MSYAYFKPTTNPVGQVALRWEVGTKAHPLASHTHSISKLVYKLRITFIIVTVIVIVTVVAVLMLFAGHSLIDGWCIVVMEILTKAFHKLYSWLAIMIFMQIKMFN